MHPHVIVGSRKEGGAQYKLSSGSILTADDMEHFIKAGCEFVTQDADGNQSKVIIVESSGNEHLRSTRNDIDTDNLNNLPTF